MKRILLLLAFAVFTWSLSAQVRQQSKTMSKGTNSSLVITIPNSKGKFVEDVWKQYTKDFYNGKTKYDRRAKEWVTEGARVKGISGGNLYAVSDQRGSDVEFTVWWDTSMGFLSSDNDPQAYDEAEKMLMQFALEVARETVKLELKEEEKNLKKAENDLDKLQKANDRYHKEIEKAQEAIKRAEEAIIQNEKDQIIAGEKIETQKAVVEAVKKKLKEI